jgi:hypothetical protein
MSTVNTGPQIVRNGLLFDLDASYMRSYSPNVYPNPTDLLSTPNMGSEIQSCTVSRDTTITRQYGSIPLKMVITGNDAYVGRYGYPAANLASALSGQTWTISVWAKASVATDGQLFIFGADTNGAWNVTPDYSAGTIAITTSWQRFSFSYTFTNANTRYIQFRLDGTNTGGSGINIWWDGLQVERASAATTFNPFYISNTTWRDVSGNINNGTLGSSTQTPTFTNNNGGAIVFDGSNDFVEITSSLGTLSQYTIMFWARRDAEGRMPVAARTSTNFYWFGDNSWYYTHGGVAGEYYYSKPTSIPLGTWGCYCVVYNGSNVSIYRQGVYQGQQATTGTANWTTGMIIGYWAGGSTYAWQGPISTVMMYNRALSASEVAQNYEADKTKFGL